jgi:hypothetical protein
MSATQGADPVSAEPAADAARMLGLIAGAPITQILHAVAALHIPDHLADGPRTATEVSGREGSHPRATYRLMRAAASLGLLSHEGEQRFGLTRQGELLRTGVPGSLRSLVLVHAGRAHWQSWALFPEAVRRGSSQAEEALGMSVFDYYAQPENAAEAAAFAEAMGGMSGLVTRGVVDALSTEGASTAVDVGGADGQLVLELMAKDLRLSGCVLDLPHAAERARQEARDRGLADRFSGVAGDFFVEVPPADLYLLKTVLHDWDDDRCVTILRNCRSAVNDGGRAVVVEMVLGGVGEPGLSTISDMVMLSVTGGLERDLDEFDALFAASGWRRTATYPVGAGYSGLELVTA